MTGLGLSLGLPSGLGAGEVGIELHLDRLPQDLELRFPASPRLPVAGTRAASFDIEVSGDLEHWSLLQQVQPTADELAAGHVRFHASGASATGFLRVRANFTLDAAPPEGSDLYGYEDQFQEALTQVGFLSPSEFATQHAAAVGFLDHIDFDPTAARYWNAFNRSPQVLPFPQNHGFFTNDFRLNDAELALFRRNGFVLSGRLGAHSFADLYYRVFSADLPVWVSSDSVLQAWHRTYAAILMELESTCLAPATYAVVKGMHDELPAAWAECSSGPLRSGVVDADFFLTVARSLFEGTAAPSHVGQSAKVAQALDAIARGQLANFAFFGRRSAPVDFSAYIPRGYYTQLPNWFRVRQWLGRVDFRVAGNPDSASPRELGSAIVLNDLLRRSGGITEWEAVSRALRHLVGPADAMDFLQLRELMNAAGYPSAASITSADQLVDLEADLLRGRFGVQQILGDHAYAPLGPELLQLPRSFCFLGLSFTPGAWALSRVVYDRIPWPESLPGKTMDGKVLRRVPSSLDVLFSVFGNDAIVPSLTARMASTTGVPFRDGYPYAHNLEAVRRVFDAQPGAAWTASVHTHWLAALRALSQPTTGAEFPQALRTRAWAMKQAQTQMASWAQLRHDNIAHVKESYTPDITCEYPDGFVEPVLPFWRSMQALANRTADVIEPLPFQGTVRFQFGTVSQEWSKTNLLARHATFLRQFARTMDQLAEISLRELAGEPLSSTEAAFLQNLIEWMPSYFGVRSFTGWYPELFYIPLGHGLGDPVLHRSDEWDPVIASVHTDVPAPVLGDPGTVVHQAVGNVALLLIAADNGPDRTVYAGPAFTAYEILPAGIQRWTDEQWKARLLSGPLPENPEWLDQTLVPSLIPIPFYAQ